MKWRPIDTAPVGEAILVRDARSWTLGKLVYLERTTPQFKWPPFLRERRPTWIFAFSLRRPIDFVPTEWCRVEHTA